jgi:hypothetical protein
MTTVSSDNYMKHMNILSWQNAVFLVMLKHVAPMSFEGLTWDMEWMRIVVSY